MSLSYLSIFHTAHTLKKRLTLALEQWPLQRGLFEVLTASIKDQTLVQKWTEDIKAWERDRSLPDPYHVITQGAYLLFVSPDA